MQWLGSWAPNPWVGGSSHFIPIAACTCSVLGAWNTPMHSLSTLNLYKEKIM